MAFFDLLGSFILHEHAVAQHKMPGWLFVITSDLVQRYEGRFNWIEENAKSTSIKSVKTLLIYFFVGGGLNAYDFLLFL